MSDFEKIEEIVNEAVIAERNRLLAALLNDEVVSIGANKIANVNFGYGAKIKQAETAYILALTAVAEKLRGE